MAQDDKSTFYQPFSMTLVPMQDSMRHWFFGQSHRKVTAPARQTPSSGARKEGSAYFRGDLCLSNPESYSLEEKKEICDDD